MQQGEEVLQKRELSNQQQKKTERAQPNERNRATSNIH